MDRATAFSESDPAGLASAPVPSPPLTPGGWSDWLGMFASLGCAIHCAAMPFVIAYLPALGLSFLADEAFHKWMAVGCLAIALLAFIPGFQKHGRLSPVLLGGVGLAMISVAAFGFAGECCPACEADVAAVAAAAPGPPVCADDGCEICATADAPVATDADPAEAPSALVARVAPWLTPLGGMVLVSAHLLNRRYGCACGRCDRESTEGAAE